MSSSDAPRSRAEAADWPKLAANPVFMPEYDVIRAAVLRARTAAGVSQKELGERIGRSSSYVALLETGQRKLDLLEAYYLFNALETDAAAALAQLFQDIRRQPPH
jgi:transcriptional regulator with XRE-family HTH domain